MENFQLRTVAMNWLYVIKLDIMLTKKSATNLWQIVKLDEHTLRVDPYTLVAGATYNFMCTVTNQVATGSGSVAVTTLPDPSG